MRQLLTTENAKTSKGESLGYRTGILYLAPANESGVMNVCQYATDGCRSSCLFTAGRGRFDSVYNARVAKTLFLHSDRETFMNTLRANIAKLIKQSARMGLRPAVRLNGTSDLPWMPLQLCSEFPTVQFYDYTKLPKPWQRVRPNYHITFSLSESNDADARESLANGVNVAAVFAVKRGQPLPKTFMGHQVIDGDLHDLRFLDSKPVVIGLRAKGEAKHDSFGFVRVAELAMTAKAGAQ